MSKIVLEVRLALPVYSKMVENYSGLLVLAALIKGALMLVARLPAFD